MGQPVAVTEHASTRPGIVRFEANRSLTGSGHERFTSIDQTDGPRPAAVLARRLLETGRVDSVHIYSNIITVDVRKGHSAEGLGDIVTELYTYYRPGFVPPSFEEPAPEGEAEATGAAAPDAAAGSSGLSEAAKKIPPHLLERSRAALARKKGTG